MLHLIPQLIHHATRHAAHHATRHVHNTVQNAIQLYQNSQHHVHHGNLPKTLENTLDVAEKIRDKAMSLFDANK